MNRHVLPAPCDEVWFEPLGGPLTDESSLRIIFAKPVRGTTIRLQIAVGEELIVLHLNQIAQIKGRQVFEASAVHLEGVQDQSPQDPLFQPSGPLRGGL